MHNDSVSRTVNIYDISSCESATFAVRGLSLANIAPHGSPSLARRTKMEVVLTFSNRITLAGALPLLVAFALAVLVAAIVLAPVGQVKATNTAKACKLSPVILDMLLDRYGKASHECNDLNISDVDGADATATLANGESATTWDFSGQELTEFAISDDDAAILKLLTDERETIPAEDDDQTDADDTVGTGPVVEPGVRYIDLTGNPLSIEDVSAANIPFNVAVILSAETVVSGFQSNEGVITENSAGFVPVAFPNMNAGEGELSIVVAFSGDSAQNIHPNVADSSTRINLIDFGGNADGTPLTARSVEDRNAN